MSWRGTLLLLILAGLAIGILLFTQRSRTRSPGEPLLGFDPSAADRITIIEGVGGAGRVEMVRQDEVWKLVSPLSDRADQGAAQALLDKASAVASLDRLKPADLKGNLSLEALNLKQPRRSVTIRAGKTHTLLFGADGAAAGQIYARVDSDPSVYLVPAETASHAFRPAAEFRDTRLTPLSADHLEEITLSKNASGGSQQLQLKKGMNGWMIESPVSARGENAAVEAWVGSLLGARIVRWMPEGTDPAACGLEPPVATLSAHEEGGVPIVISIGSEAGDTPGSRYARCNGRPGICIVSGISPALAATPASLRSKNPRTVPLDAIDRIEIGTGGQDGGRPRLLLARKKGGDDWQVVEGGAGDLSGTKIEEWHRRLSSLKASGFEPATPDRLAARGMNAPQLTIRLIAHLSENTAEESAGDMVLGEYAFGTASDGMVAMREGDSSDLMLLPEKALELAKGPEGHLSN
ncbi:MAG: DUF4340 domain-containing protein [Chthoniobacterales bacterium]